MRFQLALAICLWCAGQSSAQRVPAQTEAIGGGPLIAARQAAIADLPFHHQIDVETFRKWVAISSQCTMAEFELFLAPLDPKEQRLIDKIESLAAPIVNRLHFEDLREVLKRGQLSSYLMEEKTGSHLKHTTPQLENELFGAYDCVFASVGPPDGSPQYGDVIIRLRDSVREHGWATPFSGMHFIYAIRHRDARKMQRMLASGTELPTQATNPLSLGFDDRLHFTHYVVAEKHWEKALAYHAILVVRSADDSATGKLVEARFAKLLEEDDPYEFWKTFIPAREKNLSLEEAAARVPFGYLEGKFDNQLKSEHFTAIEVPADKLAEVRSWPEAQAHLPLIRAKWANVP